MLGYLEARFSSTELASTFAPASPPAKASAADGDTFFVLFGDFPGVPHPPAGIADGGGDFPLSTPAAYIASADSAKKGQTKNDNRAVARKKACHARASIGDGETPGAPAHWRYRWHRRYRRHRRHRQLRRTAPRPKPKNFHRAGRNRCM